MRASRLRIALFPMNAGCFKTVFSEHLGCLVAVGEHACSQGKSSGESPSGVVVGAAGSAAAVFIGALVLSMAWMSLAWAQTSVTLAANALPKAGQVLQGAASMVQSSSPAASQLTINQTTQRAAIHWQSFDIGTAAKVNVVQPNAQAVLLNRVVGQSPSQIFGQLQANGHVILVNPNGVLFGKDGSVNAGSFTASTMGISDADFMAGNMLYQRNGSTAGVLNQGTIGVSPGGYVALLGASVSNEGKIIAPQGGVALGSAATIRVPVSGSGRIKLELTASDINASVKNSGSIVSEGGQVYMQALALNRAAAQVIQSGSIDTTGEQGGAVHLLADGGTIKVDGSITANSTGTDDKGQVRKGGDIVIGRDVDTNVLAAVGDVRHASLESVGGFVETSGQYLATDGIRIQAKDWLLDPTDIKIVATGTATPDTALSTVSDTTTAQDSTAINASEVLKSTIETAINAGTNVTISTRNPTAGANGSGSITLETALSFANNSGSDATLKLDAVNGITQNSGASITQTAGANNNKVNIELLAEGKHMGVDANSTSSQGIVLNAKITTNGTVKIEASNRNTGGNSIGVKFNNNSGITAASFDVMGSAISTATSSYGVGMFDRVDFKSTGNSLINGTSLSQSTALTYGTMIYDNANVFFDAGSAGGKLVVKGSNAAWETGLRISGNYAAGTKVTTDGDVTLGALEDKSQFSFRAGTITANSGKLTVLGQVVGGGNAVSTYDGASITANNGVSVEIKGVSIGTANAVRLGENTALAVKALQGTAAIAGNITVTGQSNAGSAIWISSGSSFEAANVTLIGTSTSGTAINGTGKITATAGNVLVQGSSGHSGGYATDTNNTISATGDITVRGLGSAKHGVRLQNTVTSTGGEVTIEGDTTGPGVSGSGTGTAVTGNFAILAANDVTITGKTNGYYAINGLGNITSTNGDVTLDGFSQESRGVNFDKVITANNGLITVIGKSGAAGVGGNEHGIYFSGLATGQDVTMDGTSINNVGTFIGSLSGTNIDATGQVNIIGKSTTSTGVNLGRNNGAGADIATVQSLGDTNVSGTGVTGVRIWAASSMAVGNGTRAANLKIVGSGVTTSSGQTGYGVDFSRYPAVASLTASHDITIEGTVSGLGSGSGIKTTWSGQNGSGPAMNAGGNFSLRGNNRAAASNTQAAINADSGMQVTAGGDVVVQAETNNEAARAVLFYSLGDMFRGNTSLVSTGGDVLIQANQGSIVFNNSQASAVGSSTDIRGRNITIDNTGAGMATGSGNLVGTGGTKGAAVGTGSIDTTMGTMLAGAGKAAAESGVNFVDARNVTATGHLNIMGASGSSVGVQNSTQLTGGSVNIQGFSVTGVGIFSAGAVESTVGRLGMIGKSTASTGGSGAILQGKVDGKADINLEGYTASISSVQGLVIQEAVKSAEGNITVTGQTLATTQRAVALTANGSIYGSLQTLGNQKSITIHANTLLINAGSTVNAGSTGTVNVRTTTSGNEIWVGGADVMAATLASQKLGLDAAELNRITAAHLVIGDTAQTGNVTVTAATTTLAQTGHVTLQTGGNVQVNAALTVGDDPLTAGASEASQNLTLTGAGVTSQISQTGLIKAAGLALLGSQATATLLADNQVGVLAGNLKSLAFKNASGLTIGTVNSTSGVSASGTVSVTTGSGNLTLAGQVNTSDGTDAAVVLNAGAASAAGTAAGGDLIAAGGSVSVGAGGRATLYTGSLAGSTGLALLVGSGRYRYNSDEVASNFTTALAAGNQVVYREQPALNLQVANVGKDYDGQAFNGGAVGSVLSGTVFNGDSLSRISAGAVFAGSAQGAVNVAQSGGAITAAESVSGKSALGYATSYTAGQLSIAPKSIAVTGLTVDAKPYDGNAVAHVSAASFSGLVAGESLGLSGTGFFDSPNVNAVSLATVANVGQLTRANGTGDWGNYSLSTTGAVNTSAIGKITPVALTARVNDAALFVTQSASGAPDMGVTYTGFVNGESASSALSGLGVRTYSGAADYPTAGSYTAVYGLSAVPTANHGNYSVTVVRGALTVVPADKLLIRVDSQTIAYGQQTAAVDGVASPGSVGAYYCLDAAVACNGANLVSLNLTRLSPNRWKAADSTGSFVVFDTSISGASYSTGGYLNVGNYQSATSEISPLSLPNGNFTGRFSNAGVLTVDAQPITASYTAADKRVDGTTSAQVVSTTSGFLTGDQVADQWASASFASANVGTGQMVSVNGVQLQGADRANYRLVNPLALTTASILPIDVPQDRKSAQPQVKPVVLWFEVGNTLAQKRVIQSDVVLRVGAAVGSDEGAGSAGSTRGAGFAHVGGVAPNSKRVDGMAACVNDVPVKTAQDLQPSCVCKSTPIEGVQVCMEPLPVARAVSRAL